jgi:hypothetical protein
MEVVPFVGFGGIRFGMTADEVILALGPPDAIEDSYGDASHDYEESGLLLAYSSEDGGRLYSITVNSSTFVLNSVPIVGVSEDSLQTMGQGGILPGLALDEDFDFLDAKKYECDVFGLSFWVRDGLVSNFTMLVQFDASGDRAIWPTPPES